jgi:DNA repair exonuclease SbcCD ATPase subunit
MRLISLHTLNFKRLGTFAAEFTAGLNVISGENAHGKSTLLKAIKLALFGIASIPGKKEDIPTWGHDKWSVDLAFFAGGCTYHITRSKSTGKMRRTSRDGEAVDELVANGHTAVTEFVEDLIGVSAKDYDLFMQSRQGQSAGVLTYGATALNRKVEEFAGVDLIDKVATESARIASLYTSYAEAKQVGDEEMANAADAVDGCKAVVTEKVELAEQARRAVEAHGEFTEVAPELDPAAMRAEKTAASNLLSQLESAEAQHKVQKAALDAAEQTVAESGELRDTTEMAARLKQLVDDGQAAAAERKSADEAVQAHHDATKRADDAVAAATHAAEALPEKPAPLDALKFTITEAEGAVDRAQEARSDANSKYQALKQLSDGAECPTCGAVKEGHDPAKLEAELAAAKAELDSLTEIEKEKRRVLSEARGTLRTLEDLHRAYDQKQAELVKAAAAKEDALATVAALVPLSDLVGIQSAKHQAYDDLRAQHTTLKAELDGAGAHNDRITQAVGRRDFAKSSFDSLTAKVKELDEAYAALPEPPTDAQVQEAEKTLAAYNERKQAHAYKALTLQSEQKTTDQAMGHAKHSLSTAEANLVRLRERAAAAVADANKAELYNKLVRFLRDRRQVYLQEVWAVILGLSTKIVKQSSKGTITQILNSEGEFQYAEAGVIISCAEASGAQGALIGTALRIGLSRALYGKECPLLFDEPTESCSENNAASLSAMLSTAAKQTLLITHRVSDQALAQNIICVGE